MTASFRLILVVTSLISGATLAIAQISSFDANDEGWTVTSFNNPNAHDFGVMSSGSLSYNALV